MTPENWTELKARILHYRDLSAYFAPPYALPDLEAAWADIAELLGEMSEADLRERMRDGQLELWSPV